MLRSRKSRAALVALFVVFAFLGLGVSSGWHIHLAILSGLLSGREPRPYGSPATRLEPRHGRSSPDLPHACPLWI